MLIVFPSNWSKLISGSVVQADTWEEGWSGVESRTGFNYYSTDDDLLIQTIDRYDIVVQGVPELTCQKFMFITRLFFELETWNLGLMQSIMGHLIIKSQFYHYHLLDIPNDCVKNSKISEGLLQKIWLFHIHEGEFLKIDLNCSSSV